ncbi:YehR family lipoprotein [Staphylococcus caeli]|uniref:YehR family lipoprotein n=1 Tax=Staphylococcus caeli TaxID=2201815 RepID=UPI003F5602A2
MNKLTKLAAVSGTAIVMLAACGEKEETNTFKGDQSGVDITTKLTHKGDKVTEQQTESVLNYKDYGVEKEQVKELLDKESEKYQNIDGLEEKVKYTDDKAIETIKVDMDKVDKEELKKIESSAFTNADKDKDVSYKKTKEALEKAGFKEDK